MATGGSVKTLLCTTLPRNVGPALSVAVASWMFCLATHPLVGGDLQLARPESVGMSSDRLERITGVIQQNIAAGQVAGTVTLVARKGKVVYFRAQGRRDLGRDLPMTKDTIFAIMSMTKPIASFALMMLFEEGHFLLTDPVSKWLPEFADVKLAGGISVGRPITIRHALTHTTGLSRPPSPSRQMSALPKNVVEFITLAARLPLHFRPGDQWEYGISTDLVAALVEKILGQSLDVFLRERIFDPLEMSDTHYHVPQAKSGRIATLYTRGEEGKIVPRQKESGLMPRTVFRGAHGLSSTAADYYRFHQMILSGGEFRGVRLASPKTIDLMISNHTGDLLVRPRGPGYGFGLGYSVLTDPAKAREPLSPGSFGWGGAYGTYFFVDPQEDLLGIIMMQLAPFGHLSLRHIFAVLATTSIIEPNSSPPRIQSYSIPR